MLRVVDNSFGYGQGNSTVFDYSQIDDKHALILGRDSHLSNLKIYGSINPLPNNFTQGMRTDDNVIIDNVLISHTNYGIITNNKSNITLKNIRCGSIQSKRLVCMHTRR